MASRPTKKRSPSVVARARLLNADDAAVMALMALSDHLTTINKFSHIAKLLGAGPQADSIIGTWASRYLQAQ